MDCSYYTTIHLKLCYFNLSYNSSNASWTFVFDVDELEYVNDDAFILLAVTERVLVASLLLLAMGIGEK